MSVDEINASLGKKIRNLRNRNGLTQQELADRTELTKGFISQLERGQVSPSVATLLDLIECLGTTASDFFRQEEPTVVFCQDQFFEKVDEDGNITKWLVPSAQKNAMEPLRVEIQPGSGLKEDKPHMGEEFGYLLQGSLVVTLDEEEYVVGAGQSFYYAATRNHRLENRGDEPAVLIWVSTPPSF